MKIVHVVEPFASGIAVFVRALTENLKDDFHIIIHGERNVIMNALEVRKSFPVSNVQFIQWESVQRAIDIKNDALAFLKLYRVLKKLKMENQIDAVHLHSSKSGFLGRIACRLINIRNVIYTPNGAPFLNSKRMVNLFYKLFEKLGNAFGGKVVCCSPSELTAYKALGINAVNINNGVSLKIAKRFQRVRKKNLKFRILNCARITSQKNPSLFNEIAKYFEEIEQFEFVWVGDGEDRHLLTARNITVSGWLPEEKAKALVSTANLYLSTSHYEGLSFSVLEALALKKPVLLKDCVGNRDVVKSGLNGNLFDHSQEAILKIFQYFNNPDMLSVMGEYSSRLCTEAFDIRSTCLMYYNLYKGLMNS